jgi:metal-responsive CopG/Arc/MetJ family transcriptional regulator
MKNVQITVDEETLREIDRIGKPLGLKRSAIVRLALRDWLNRQLVDGFEKEWIRSLEAAPDKASRAAEWIDIQAWSRK